MQLLTLALLVPLALAQSATDLRELSQEGPLFEAEVQVDGHAPERFSFGFAGPERVRAFVLNTESRPGVGMVIGGHGRTNAPPGKSGLTVLFFVHLFHDGKTLLEAQILNDAIESPPGKVRLRYKIRHRGQIIGEGDQVVFDETGVCHFSAAARMVARQDLLLKYIDKLPPVLADLRVHTADAEPGGDSDPTKNTHAKGSPRNGYHAVAAVKYLWSQDARYLDRLLDFVAAQSRRPYHLSEKSGEPFLASRHPDVHIIEGKPELRAGRDTLGRSDLTQEQREWGQYNGWDHGHMSVEELYAAYMLIGSRVARREMVLIGEQILTTPYVRIENYRHISARTFGWVVRALVQIYRATGEARYIDAAKHMIRSLAENRVEGPHPALVPQQPGGGHIEDERWESPFHVAVAASGLALYLEERPDDGEAKDLLLLCGDLLVGRGFCAEKGGFYYDYSVDSARTSGSGEQLDGVVMWLASPLIEVADHAEEAEKSRYLEPARLIYEANKESGHARPRRNEYYRWFLRCGREFR